MNTFYALGSLFLAALTAATVLPGQSEVVLVYLLSTGKYALWLLIAVAATGNILGSITNWWLGKYVTRFQGRKWFPVSEKQLQTAQDRFKKYGYWTLLLAWVPLIGDPLTVAAGVLHVPFKVFFPLVAGGKLARYVVVAAVYLQIF